MAAGKWNMQKASGGVASITVADGVGATNIVLPESGTLATTSNIVGFKNYIINGNFDVWQRGVSQTINGYGSNDRWFDDNQGSTKTHSRQTCTDVERVLFNAQYYSRTIVSSVVGTSNYTNKIQSIEDVTKLAGKTVTLSFWARADSTKNIAIEFAQLFGYGGTPSSNIFGASVTTFNLTSTWQKFTKIVTLPSIVGKTLGTDGVNTSYTSLLFWFDAGSDLNTRTNSLGKQSGTFDIAQVQLEEGSVATPFENRPIGLELSLCQRYYETGLVSIWQGQSSTYRSSTYLNFKNQKRVPPSISLSHVENNGYAAPTTEWITTNGFNYTAISNTSTPDGRVTSNFIANSEL